MFRGADVIARPYVASDEAAFTSLVCDPCAMSPLGGPAPDPASLFRRVLREPMPNNGAWAVIHRKAGHYLGHVFVSPSRLVREPELGFVFCRPFWGRGFASQAVPGVVEALRVVSPSLRLAATVDVENSRSQSVLARAGFQLRGTQYDDDGPYLIYVLPNVPAAQQRAAS